MRDGTSSGGVLGIAEVVAPTSKMKVSSNYQGKVGVATEGEHPNALLVKFKLSIIR